MKHSLFFAALLLLIAGCKKDTEIKSPFPPRSNENPVAMLAFSNGTLKPGFNLTASSADYPSEYGIQFTVSKKGNLYALGLDVPDTGKYILTLWDVNTKKVLLRDSTHYTQTAGVLYIDFGPSGRELELKANTPYMASVFMPHSPSGAPLRYYTLLQSGVQNWVPFTQKHITVQGTFFTKTDAPAYPDVQVLHSDVLNGLVDIGYYATEY